jgi:hypothetical protein
MYQPVCRISEFIGVDGARLTHLGAYDGFIGTDSRLFLDPFLFEGIDIPEFSGAREKIRAYFARVIKLLKLTNQPGNRIWQTAVNLLVFKENSGLALGYGQGSTHGSAIGLKLANDLARSAKELLNLGINDPEIFELVGLFIKDFGPDRLSDMTVKILSKEIVNYTSSILERVGPLRAGLKYKIIESKQIPLNLDNKPILLLPKAVLRELPVAQSFEEIGEAAAFSQELRRRYNELLGGLLAVPKSQRKKDKIKEYLFEDPDRIRVVAESYSHVNPENARYDFESDPAGENFYYEAGVSFANDFATKKYSIDETGLREVVQDVISHFRRCVEVHGGWELLYNDDKRPRSERSAQLLFFITAQKICEKFDVRVSRESADGRGAVDFTFSKGFHGAIVVEIKLSSNRDLYHGFETQLPIYADVERCNYAEYVVIQVSANIPQLSKIKKLIGEKKKENKWVPGLTIVDALPKPTASVA